MKITSEAKKPPNDPSQPFKEKEKGDEGGSKALWPMEGSMLGGQWNVPSLVDPKLCGQWKVPCLVANGMFQAWWPMEGSKLGGQWKVPCLVANGMFQAWWPMECFKFGGHWKVKEKHLFTSFIFPQHLYLHLQFFSLTSQFYFTMVLSCYSHLSFLFFDL